MCTSTSPQQMFNLKWNNFESSMSSSLHEQLAGEELVDVTLTAEGRLASAHRLVLSACSPYFRQLFRTLANVHHPVVVIRDARFCDIQALLAFIYQGEVQVSNSDLPSLLRTAEALSIKGLTPSQQDSSEPLFNQSSEQTSDYFWRGSTSSGTATTEKHSSSSFTATTPDKNDLAPASSSKRARVFTEDREPSGIPGAIGLPLNLSSSSGPSPLLHKTPLTQHSLLSEGPLLHQPPTTDAEMHNMPESAMTIVRQTSEQDAGGKLSFSSGEPPRLPVTALEPNAANVPFTRVEWETRTSPMTHLLASSGDYLTKEKTSAVARGACSSVTPSGSSFITCQSGNAPVWKNLLPKPARRMLPVKCPECSKLISNAYNLRVHMDLHKDLTYICTVCSTPTRSRDTLRKHITNIHKVKGEQLREMLDKGVVTESGSGAGLASLTTVSASCGSSLSDSVTITTSPTPFSQTSSSSSVSVLTTVSTPMTSAMMTMFGYGQSQSPTVEAPPKVSTDVDTTPASLDGSIADIGDSNNDPNSPSNSTQSPVYDTNEMSPQTD